MTQIQSDEGRLLLRQIAALEDTIISQKKMLSDILYNLDSDNVPELRKISRIISDNGEQMSEIIQEVDSITLRVSDAEVGIGELQLTANSFDVRLLKTEGDIDDMPSTIEAVISSEINDTGGIIQAYVEGKNFITQEGADGLYTKISNLNAGIEAYIDSETGAVKVTQAVSGTYQKIDQMGNYVLNANLNSGISSYIDSEAGRVGINSAVSGTYQRIDQMGNYATTQNVSAIEQTVTQQGASIALVVGSSRVVDGNGNVNGSIVISAINGVGSQALINFDKINITGVTTFLKASDVGAGGQTVIDGGRISTETLLSDRIARAPGTSYIHLASQTAVQGILAVGSSFTSSNFRAAQLYRDGNNAFIVQNSDGHIEVKPGSGYVFRCNGYTVLTTANLVAQ